METTRPPRQGANDSGPNGVRGQRPPLTQRESEILALLARGRSGAQIADELVLSPETVRSHVRNAMSKLGATTRSHAVALALQSGEIGTGTGDTPEDTHPHPEASSAEMAAALQRMLGGLQTLYDVDGGGVYLSEDDALSMRLVAATKPLRTELPTRVTLGEGMLGRAALERRSQLCQEGVDSSSVTLIAAPITGGGTPLGVIALSARLSRPISRSELLLLQAFSNRIGEVLATGGDVRRRLVRAMDQFRSAWSAASRAN
jgi:DNA-binding CsgD family transcriptional regulator